MTAAFSGSKTYISSDNRYMQKILKLTSGQSNLT